MGTTVDGRARAQRGASLVEMVLVIALASVLLGAAWPSVASYREAADLRSAALHLGAALGRGRAAALGEGRTWQLRLDGNRRWILAPLGDEAPPEELPGAAFVAEATSGGDVRFFSSGLADNATFTLGAGMQRRRVVVNQRGRVTLE